MALKKHLNQLKKEVIENTTIVKKNGKTKEETVIKQGLPLDKTVKTQPISSTKFIAGSTTLHNPNNPESLGKAQTIGFSLRKEVVGLSLGSTVSMGNFESLRVDIWLSREVGDNENSQEVLDNLKSLIEENLQTIIGEYKDS